MFGILTFLMFPLCSPATEDDGKIFKEKYHPQIVLMNRRMAMNLKNGCANYDTTPWNKKADVVEVKLEDSFQKYLQRTLKPQDYDAWYKDIDWRYDCWNDLDDYINGKRYNFGKDVRLCGLTKLKKHLGEANYRAGWMPAPIPDMTEKIIWLQDLWTDKTDFQGRKNQLSGANPLK